MLATDDALKAAYAIAQDATLAEVAAALHARQIRPLLIRGPVIARWLYDDLAERPYGDIDLLVRPEAYAAAGVVLASLDFADTSKGMRPDEQHPSESHWTRIRDRFVCVDLHHRITLVPAPPVNAWELFAENSSQLSIAGLSIDTPSPTAHLVIIALHAAHHGAEEPKPLEDLRRAIERVDGLTWERAAEFATDLGAAHPMREGLKLVAGGGDLADRLKLPDGAPRLVRLHARTAPATSSGIERLIQTRGVRARLVLLGHRFAPSPAYMREWQPLAGRGRIGLALAYFWRPVWLLWKLPRGAAAWSAVALPQERRARFPAFLAGGWWALRAWWRCRRQLRRGGLQAVTLPVPPANRPGAHNGIQRTLTVVRASCLERSLVRQRWFAAQGRPCDIVIGIRGPVADFGAHAWLDGDPEDTDVFTELKRWPPPREG